MKPAELQDLKNLIQRERPDVEEQAVDDFIKAAETVEAATCGCSCDCGCIGGAPDSGQLGFYLGISMKQWK